MSILKLHNVSIRYITGDFKDIGLKEYVLRHLKRNYHVVEFWADRHISFSMEKGDTLGIIGANGAGKSTLLKAISGIMEPTEGWIERNGEISALLELGSGFDPELTVKENAYLRGAMLGYTREFMDKTYDQILDFSELREFEHRPFKQLSSGMKSRLAFSIASLVKPDILILDEVLAVGDGAFKRKSEMKMREIMEQGAATILVSHSIGQVRQMCNKVLWLHKGRQIAFGSDVQEICDRYEAFLMGDISQLRGEGSGVTEEMLTQEENRGLLSIDALTYDFRIKDDLLKFTITNAPEDRDLCFAYYVVLNGKRIYTQNYSFDSSVCCTLKESGTYYVMYHLMEDGVRQCQNSVQITYTTGNKMGTEQK